LRRAIATTTLSGKPSPLRASVAPAAIMAERWLGELEQKGYETIKAEFVFKP
jgi:hypothetical protein